MPIWSPTYWLITKVLLLEPTRILTINICGITIHSDLGIKPGTKLRSFNNKSKPAFRNRLSEVKRWVIDELSMISNDIGSILREILIPEKAFAALLVMTVAGLLQ